MAKQLGLPHRPWITLDKTSRLSLITVNVSVAQCYMSRTKTRNCGLAGCLTYVKVQTPHMRVCLCLCMPLYLLHVPLCIYVQCVGASHTPAGLWSPESEEDMDTEQRRLLATLEPWSMLGWKPACRRACLVRWSLLMKHLSHSGQLKRFSPVCVR